MKRLVLSLVLAASFLQGCASCPPVDEEAIAQRVVELLRQQFEGEDESVGEEAESVADLVAFDALPRRGPEDARVRILVVSDFECPFCGRIVPSLNQLENEFHGQIAVYFLNYPLPFHSRARAAANAAIEAFALGGDEAFFRMHDKLFSNQRTLSDDDLARFGTEIGLDGAAIRAAVTSGKYDSRINAELGLGAQLGVEGTPTVFVNETRIVGAQDYSAYRDAIRAELEE